VTDLDHVTLSVAAPDFERRLAFYDAALGALGLTRVVELVDEEEEAAPVEAVGWGSDGSAGLIWLVIGEPPTAGLHVRLRADSRSQVETFHADAVQAGGAEHAAPRRWVLYRRGEFIAIVADPAGNLIEAVAAE
jgi:catechol 2,3-dioxygenase-like lactoylglutathione lyase family enzyme